MLDTDMKIKQTMLSGVVIVEPTIYGDHRGWFIESWSKQTMDKLNLSHDFVQDNHSYSSKKGIIRGLHLQVGDGAQAKLVRCTRGSILDVAVDLRKDSPTFKKWISVILSSENKKQLLIPRGFAHGFLTLTDEVEVQYKTDQYYAPDTERTICWNDSELNIDWGISQPVLSEKDSKALCLSELDIYF